MAQAWEYIKIALMNIRSNKGRSILTMLGIIIGITSVIMIISIGDGVKGQVNDELNAMAGGLIGIYVNNEHSEEEVYFDSDDFEAIKEKVPGVKQDIILPPVIIIPVIRSALYRNRRRRRCLVLRML